MSCENTKSCRDLKLQDTKCMLLQFSNERKKLVQIGFQAWLKDHMNTEEYKLVNTEVVIHWLLVVDIMSAKPMQKKLQSRNNDKWVDLPVKVLAVGGKIFFFVFIYLIR